MKDWDDKSLFDAVRVGDQDALSILFLRHYDYLMHYGLQQGTKRTTVEECIQELFLHLFETSDQFNEVHLVRAYLFKSLRRRIYAAHQVDMRSQRLKEFGSNHIQVQFCVEDLIIEGERQERTKKMLVFALNKLPTRQKEAIYLRYYGGLSTGEIAEVMGTANQTILNTLHLALKKLRMQRELRKI